MIENKLIQLIAVAIIVTAAATWLVIRMVRTLRRRARRDCGCQGCSISEICSKPSRSSVQSCCENHK